MKTMKKLLSFIPLFIAICFGLLLMLLIRRTYLLILRLGFDVWFWMLSSPQMWLGILLFIGGCVFFSYHFLKQKKGEQDYKMSKTYLAVSVVFASILLLWWIPIIYRTWMRWCICFSDGGYSNYVERLLDLCIFAGLIYSLCVWIKNLILLHKEKKTTVEDL